MYNKYKKVDNNKLIILFYMFIGILFALCGFLKLYVFSIAIQPDSPATLILMILAEAEALGGICLVLGGNPTRSRLWAVAALAGLGFASFCQVLSGRCSSGRLGVLPISPWAGLLLDTAALATLLRWQPPEGRDAEPPGPLHISGWVVVALLAAYAGLGQPDLVAAEGTASQGGSPLEEVPLALAGEGVEFRIRTGHDGSFRLPPIRPGLYAVTLAETSPRPAPVSAGKGGSGGPLRQPSLVPGKKGTPAKRASGNAGGQSSGSAGPEGEEAVALLRIESCHREKLSIHFPAR